MENRRHRYIESVYVGQPHIQSRAAYLKLRRRLKNQDPTEDYKMNPGFRIKFLTERLKEKGELVCEYCGKKPLLLDPKGVPGHIVKSILATLDHINPKSNGGARYLKENIKVACPKCNSAKENFRAQEFDYINKEKMQC